MDDGLEGKLSRRTSETERGSLAERSAMFAFLLSRGLSVNVSMCVLLTPPPTSAHPVPVTASLLCRSWSSFPVGLA